MNRSGAGLAVWSAIWLKALRVRHWAKNFLVFLPLIGLGLGASIGQFTAGLVAFVSLSLAASSVYLLNDVLDRQHDRHHEAKQNRPVAAGHISAARAVGVGTVLAVIALVISSTNSWSLSIVVAIYWSGAIGYGLVAKRLIALDIVVLAGLFLVRIYAGSVASDIPVSHWLFATAFFAFYGLASAKRVVEIQGLSSEDSGAPIQAIRGRAYQYADREAMQVLGVVASFSSTVLLTLFIDDRLAETTQSFPMAWLGLMVWVVWLSRFWILISRRTVSHDPIDFVTRDPASVVAAISIALIFLVFG